MNELENIRKRYEKRKSLDSRLYSYFNDANLFIIQSRERKILELIKKYFGDNLNDKKILDVGCGTGGVLRDFIKYGVKPENLYGVDLLEDRIEQAKYLSPNINFSVGNAENLPYPNDYFDIVMQFTMFTSIFDDSMKRNIAKEMLRVLKSDGIILWYDFIYNNQKNPDVRGVKKKEIYELFPNCEIRLEQITLAPPLTRMIAPYSYFTCYLLEKLKVFNTHYIGVIIKQRK